MDLQSLLALFKFKRYYKFFQSVLAQILHPNRAKGASIYTMNEEPKTLKPEN